METKLLAGLWRIPITPPLDSPIVGGVDPLVMEEILDDLYANALVLDDGAREVAIVSVDVIGLPYRIVQDIVSRIAKCCGIPADQVTLSATHTHKGPRLYAEGGDPYTENLKKLIVTAVHMAKARKQPARIGVGRGRNTDLVFNRRLKKPDGSVVMNWVDAEYVQDCRGDGPVDPELIALRIETPDRKPIGFVINYANHNNALPGGVISADIAGHMGELLRRIYGQDVVTVFLLGTCGNVNWLDYRAAVGHACSVTSRSPTYYQDIATGLTGTVLEIIPRMEYPDVSRIASLRETIQISERPFEEYDTRVDGTYGPINGQGSKAFFERMHGRAKEESEGQEPGLYDVEIHAVRIGDEVVMATLPGEIFVEYGLEIKARSPFRYTIVAELTNGSVGYIPTPEAYAEGGYEVRKPANRLEKDAGRRMTDVALKLLRELAG